MSHVSEYQKQEKFKEIGMPGIKFVCAIQFLLLISKIKCVQVVQPDTPSTVGGISLTLRYLAGFLEQTLMMSQTLCSVTGTML